MSAAPAIYVEHLVHRYGRRLAVRDLTLRIDRGEVFTFLGPNGSGKTTLFRVLSTLIPQQAGRVRILNEDLSADARRIRERIGVVFQAPSVDGKLTVAENLKHQGHLYGLAGSRLRERSGEMLARLGLSDRGNDRVETLSGGLRRRVELAKAMLHRPQLLLLDEPSTGLDPGARSDLWRYLNEVRERDGVTVVLTTHLLDEAERADRIGIMHQGELVALDTPDALRATVGGDAITIRTNEPQRLAEAIGTQHNCLCMVVDGGVRLEQPDGHQWIPRLAETFGDQIDSITVGKPTLEDVFIDRTGHQFWDGQNEQQETANDE